jgi:IS5 family transposase
MHQRYRVELEESERQQLTALVAGGRRGVRAVKRARNWQRGSRRTSRSSGYDGEEAPTPTCRLGG